MAAAAAKRNGVGHEEARRVGYSLYIEEVVWVEVAFKYIPGTFHAYIPRQFTALCILLYSSMNIRNRR